MVNESASVVPILQSLEDFFEGINGCDELALIETDPLAAVGMRVVLEPFVVGGGIEVVGPRIDSHLEWPQRVMQTLELGMVGKQLKPLLGDFAGSSESSRVDDPADLLDERL